jgi:hypothetical protein
MLPVASVVLIAVCDPTVNHLPSDDGFAVLVDGFAVRTIVFDGLEDSGPGSRGSSRRKHDRAAVTVAPAALVAHVERRAHKAGDAYAWRTLGRRMRSGSVTEGQVYCNVA